MPEPNAEFTVPGLCVCARAPFRAKAEQLAGQLGAPLLAEAPAGGSYPLCLRYTAEGLTLEGGGLALRGDFRPLLRRAAPSLLGQELPVRAARIKGLAAPTLIDATAGLGEDSFLLAAAGFRVTMFERNPVTAALLSDALERGAADAELAPILARMRLRAEDSRPVLAAGTETADVIFLDPMFPPRQKSSLVGKKLQLLQRLEPPCEAEEELLRAALAAAPRKIVIKRPRKGPFLGEVKPSYSLSGKTVRYDCLLPPPPKAL